MKKARGSEKKETEKRKKSASPRKEAAEVTSHSKADEVSDHVNGNIREPEIAQLAPSIHRNEKIKTQRRFEMNTVILVSELNKPESQMTPLEKMNIVRDGVSKTALEHLKDKTELDYDKLAKVLSVARATLINKKGKEKFGPGLSEKILGLADIYSYGYKVFEDEARFNQWIFNPNMALGGQTPFDFIDNQFGREEVKSLIGRIDYGVFS